MILVSVGLGLYSQGIQWCNSRPAKTKKTHFGRHGMLMQSYHTRSIRHRILRNIRVDDTLDLTFQCHFQGHKVKKWQK